MEEGQSVFAFIGGESSESDVSEEEEEEDVHMSQVEEETKEDTGLIYNTAMSCNIESQEEEYRLPEDIRALEVGAIGSSLRSNHESVRERESSSKWTALERRLVLCQGDEGIFRGEYASVLMKDEALFRILETSDASSIEDLAQVITTRLNEENTCKVLVAAIGSLHAFVQSNWTGPRLDEHMNEIRPVTTIKATDSETQSTVHINESSLASTKPAQTKLKTTQKESTTTPSLAMRVRDAFKFTKDDVMSALTSDCSKPYRLLEHAECLLLSRVLFRALELQNTMYSAFWWSARAQVIHLLMLKDSEDTVSIWKRAANLLARSLRELHAWWPNCEERSKVSCMVLLEGVRLHLIANYLTLAKQCLEMAQKELGIHIELTGIEGKRTKFQQRAIAQLVLLLSRDKKRDSPTTSSKSTEQIRDVRIEDLDEETHLLEHAKLNDAPETATGRLSVIEQQLLLLRAQILSKSRAMESTLIEEMRAHVERVFVQPESHTVQISALLMRSRLEIAKASQRERALLQMQTIVDDLRGNVVVVVEENSKTSQTEYASTRQRFRNFHGTPLRPLWEIRKELGGYYLGTGMIKTASSIFESLELWDEAVSCMIVMGQHKKAVKRVRDMIDRNPTPELYCLMGSLTKEDVHFHKAWAMSGGKYGRAMRQLGRLEFEKEDLENAAKHMSMGLAQSPLRIQDWFLLGSIYLRLKRYHDALAPFQRVVAQQSEDANAWANLAATHARLNGFDQAYSAMKMAVKHKQSDVKMWNNLIVFCIQVRTPNAMIDAIQAIHKILSLRKSTGNVDIVVHPSHAASLLECIFSGCKVGEDSKKTKNNSSSNSSSGGNEDKKLNVYTIQDTFKSLRKPMGEVLNRSCQECGDSDPRLWTVAATFYSETNQLKKALACHRYHCVALVKQSGWQRDQEKLSVVRVSVARLVQTCRKVLDTEREDVVSIARWLRAVNDQVVSELKSNADAKMLSSLVNELGHLVLDN